MNKEELIGKLQMVYVGDKNALNEMIGYYDGLKEVIEILKQENQKYKEVIDKAIEYINSNDDGCYSDNTLKYKIAELNITELLQILKGEE